MTTATKSKIRNAQKERWDAMTPGQKKKLLKKMAAGRKKASKLKGRTTRGTRTQKEEGQAEGNGIEEHAIWLAGYFQGQLEQYSRSNQIPVAPLTAGVLGILRHSQVR